MVSRFFFKKPTVRSITSGLGIGGLLNAIILSPLSLHKRERGDVRVYLGYLAVKGITFCTPSAVKVAAPFPTLMGTAIFGISVHHFSRRAQAFVFFAFTCSWLGIKRLKSTCCTSTIDITESWLVLPAGIHCVSKALTIFTSKPSKATVNPKPSNLTG